MEQNNKQDSLIKSIKILAEITKKDIQKLYNLENFLDIEASYSSRYGWTLKKTNRPSP
jgi:hypothetical protein|tara:strand:+ start:311 stop:484 length:174 start_codon:yes stop_codon:yes gene_type:complete